MIINLNVKSIQGSINKDLFGANILAPRDRLGENGTYDNVVDNLGVETIRYPGGALTEFYFDLKNPNANKVMHSETGEEKDFLPYNEFMNYAEQNEKSVTVVLPTRHYLSDEEDINGDRYPDIERNILKTFIRNTLDGKYGSPKIKAFEIGNEYWGSGGMSSVEYGRVVDEMSVIIRDEINNHPEYSTKYFETDILTQMGNNYGNARLTDFYSQFNSSEEALNAASDDYNVHLDFDSYAYNDNDVNWTKVANKLIINELSVDAKDSIDGVVAHIYSKGSEYANSRCFDLNNLNSTWKEEMPFLDTYVTEWNVSSSTGRLDPGEDYGLKQAHEILNVAESMILNEVDTAHIWPVQQNTKTDLSYDEGETELTVAGEMFKMMSQSLPGKSILNISDKSGRETEYEGEVFDLHTFVGKDEMVMYVASKSNETEVLDVDMNGLMESFSVDSIKKLGVAEGDSPTNALSKASIEQINPDEAIFENILETSLEPYEIIEVKFQNVDYSEQIDVLMNQDNNDDNIIEDDNLESEEDSPTYDMFDILSGGFAAAGILLFLMLL
jgi:hypothetical protein